MWQYLLKSYGFSWLFMIGVCVIAGAVILTGSFIPGLIGFVVFPFALFAYQDWGNREVVKLRFRRKGITDLHWHTSRTSVEFSWRWYHGAGFIRVLRSPLLMPPSAHADTLPDSDCVRVYEGGGTGFVDSGLAPSTDYRYAIFVRKGTGWSEPVHAWVTPTDGSDPADTCDAW